MRLVILLLVLVPLYGWGQNLTANPTEAVSLSIEISRLEKLSLNGTDANMRFEAFLALARLYQLSGNSDAVLKSLDAALAVIPGESQALLEKGRLLISLGEYDKAAEAVAGLLTGDREKDVLLQARYLIALLEAFRSGNLRLLSALAEEGDFVEFRSVIYYALWRLGDDSAWKARLAREFPNSPEAVIAQNPASAIQTPLWLLFPGRDSIRLTELPLMAVQPTQATSAASAGDASSSASAASAVTDGAVLQVGLFSQEDNARAVADRLTKAGFAPWLQQRLINGSNFWAVVVSGGRDSGAVTKKLKDAGFESFPVKL